MADLSRRPRLLFLCQTLPYPPDGGVWIRTYHILRLLSRAFDITALCFERAASAGTTMDPGIASGQEGLGRFAKVEVFTIPQKHSRMRFIWDHARSILTGRVYTHYLYESRPFRRRVSELLRTHAFDLIHVDSLDLSAYLPAFDGMPVVCVHHDIESTLLRRRAALETKWSRRWYLRLQSRLMHSVERHCCERLALNITMSEADRASLQRIAPSSRVEVLANGVDLDEFAQASAPGEGIAYVGGTTPFPNLDALDYFCAQILPHLRAAVPHLPVWWIGRASVEQQREYRERLGVQLTGYVADVRPYMQAAACHIVPLRTGGGTRLKILNSWAMGRPVVSTTLGCEGLDAVDEQNILIRDHPRAFAAAVMRVLESQSLALRLGKGGRATVEQAYSWDAIGEELIATYRSVRNEEPSCGRARLAPTGAHLAG